MSQLHPQFIYRRATKDRIRRADGLIKTHTFYVQGAMAHIIRRGPVAFEEGGLIGRRGIKTGREIDSSNGIRAISFLILVVE